MRWKMLDRIEQLEETGRAVGCKGVTSTEDYFEHHMPMFPVVPGTMMVETMAQLAGRLAMYVWEKKNGSPVWAAVSGIEEARFHEFVQPGVLLRAVAELVELKPASALASCEISVSDQLVATARIGFLITGFDPDHPGDRIGLDAMRWEMRGLWPDYDLE